MIYFITAREIGRVKIGYSAEPRSRFIKMRTDSPVPLELERICDGTLSDERILHAQFAHWRCEGEWFELSPAIEAHMETLALIGRKARKIEGSPLGDWIAANCLTLGAFAAQIGSTQVSMSRICSGKQEPSVALIRKIVIATGGEVSADALIFPDGRNAPTPESVKAA